MKLKLNQTRDLKVNASIRITGSKSETNRLLLLQALYPSIRIHNLSNSDDGHVMQNGLQTGSGEVDIHHAGTAMRFLTAFFASQEGIKVVLTGSARMKERPIQVLVNALKSIGADIEYVQKAGYPPLRISGKKLLKNKVALPANVSSQYISALLLIAPRLQHGLELELMGKITSVPYIKMTLSLLEQVGIQTSFEDHSIRVWPKQSVPPISLTVESDWSSASYFYSVMALSETGSQMQISSYKSDSLQGDSILQKIYASFGVETSFSENIVTLRKIQDHSAAYFEYDLSNAPDLAQTISVTCFGLKIGCHLTGLHTLPIKETDRLAALQTELTKLGAQIETDSESLTMKASEVIHQNVAIDTYHDHRMAMAFAPLAFRTSLRINDAEVVSKSYPDFWKDLQTTGVNIEKC